ncbi:putative methyl-accepting chemotaxis protein [Pillotina sp. SPG140]|jgi:methyl-accepting chemotaxis protein
MKLKMRLTLTIAAIVVTVIAVLSTVLLSHARTLQADEARENLKNLTGRYSATIQVQYENYLTVAKTLAEIMSAYQDIPVEERRTRFDDTIEGIMKSNPLFMGMFTLWKPRVLDDQDSEYINTSGSDSTGRYMSWFTRRSGSLEKYPISEYELYHEIAGNLDLNEPVFNNPTWAAIRGKDVLTARLCYPIVSNAAIVGRVGIMLDLSPFSEFIKQIQPYGTGRAVLFSNNGTVAAHYNAALVGKNIRDPEMFDVMGEQAVRDTEITLETGEPNFGINKGRMFESFPFYVGGVKTAWTLLTSVPQVNVMEGVNTLTNVAIIIAVIAVIITMIITFVVAGAIAKPIITISANLKDISEGEGDLTKSIVVPSKDEIGNLAHYFNRTLEKIRSLVLVIKKQSDKLFSIGSELAVNMHETTAAIDDITSNIQVVSQRVINQSASVNETSATMGQITLNIERLNNLVERQTNSVTQSSSAIEQMVANIQSVTQTLVKNTKNVQDLASASEVGRSGLQTVATDIQEIARQSEGLLEINAVMENIASQTNLLSMNAAIEAAHAGEAGKGFAVVADEIRKLSESSSEQSQTISNVLKKIKDSIDKIMLSTETVLNKFEAIDSSVKTVTEQEENIKNAMEEQGQGSKQILEAVTELNDLTGQVKNSSLEMLGWSQQIIQESRKLEAVTEEIALKVNNMANGADQIDSTVNRVNEISVDNKASISTLVTEVSRFKVD